MNIIARYFMAILLVVFSVGLEGAPARASENFIQLYGNPSTAGQGNSNQLIKYSGPLDPAINTLESSSLIHSLEYDGNGNRTRLEKVDSSPGAASVEIVQYGYDRSNRLTSVTGDGLNESYLYDYRTRRIGRSESAKGASLVSFNGGTSAAEWHNRVPDTVSPITVAPSLEYIRGSDYGGGIGGILYTIPEGEPAVANTYNTRGDVVSRTEEDLTYGGVITWQGAYEAFGTRVAEDGATDLRQMANTKEEDPTGLLNEGFRYRDLETGVWLTRDPAEFVDGPNVYTYVSQNPWTYFDPLGLQKGRKYSAAQSASKKRARERTWNSPGGKIVKGAAMFVGGFIPYVGDAMDGHDVVSPNSTATDRAVGGTSLAVNAWTLGLAPNAGPIRRGGMEIGEGFMDFFRGTDEALDGALDVSARELKESQADALRHMAQEGEIPSATTRGNVNEARKLDELGEVKNTEKISTSEGDTIPDYINDTQIGEIKDTKVLANTAQMRGQREAAKKAGKEHVVDTCTNTKVYKTMEESGSTIRRHDDLGPQTK